MPENPLEVPGIRWFFGSLATNLFVSSLVVVFRSSLPEGLMTCDLWGYAEQANCWLAYGWEPLDGLKKSNVSTVHLHLETAALRRTSAKT